MGRSSFGHWFSSAAGAAPFFLLNALCTLLPPAPQGTGGVCTKITLKGIQRCTGTGHRAPGQNLQGHITLRPLKLVAQVGPQFLCGEEQGPRSALTMSLWEQGAPHWGYKLCQKRQYYVRRTPTPLLPCRLRSVHINVAAYPDTALWGRSPHRSTSYHESASPPPPPHHPRPSTTGDDPAGNGPGPRHISR